MKVDKKFVRVYDRIFAYILDNYGLDDLIKFWKAIASTMLQDLQEIANKKGLQGCYDYWDKVLKEEGCKYRIKLKDNKLTLDITDCSSIRELNIPSCKEYCRHCGVMYEDILNSAGLKYTWKKLGGNRCEIVVER